MKYPQGAQAIERAFSVLLEVARHHKEGKSLTDLTYITKLNKATVYRLLYAMKSAGMIDQDPVTLCYHLGPQCYALGKIAEDRFGIVKLASESVERLAKFSRDVAFFSTRIDTNAICMLREDGDYPLRSHVLQPGTKTPLGVHSANLAMLAALSDPEAEEIIKSNAAVIKESFPMLTPSRLWKEIREARKYGYAVNPGLVVEGSWGIGVAVRSPKGEVIAALSIAAIESRMGEERRQELGVALKKEAAILETKIKKIETLS